MESRKNNEKKGKFYQSLMIIFNYNILLKSNTISNNLLKLITYLVSFLYN